MACPADITIHNLSGRWELNRELSSDNLEDCLTLMGVPYMLRKVMVVVKVTETVEETTNAEGSKGLIVTKAAAGLKGQTDTFDGSSKEVIMDGGYFGAKIRVRSWWINAGEKKPLEPNGVPVDPYLLKDWLQEEPEGHPQHFIGSGFNEKSTGLDNMVWGFCDINGERYRAVKYYIRKGGKDVRARLIFNWVGPL